MRPQHRKFAAEYIKNGNNGVQAVFKAGYQLGYNAACVRASTLLRNIKVKSMIDAITDDAIADAELTEKRVKREVAKIAFAKVKEIDSTAKMKGLDLATKILGMQSSKLETIDLTEQKAISSSIELKIASLANSLNISPEQASIQFFSSLSDFGSDHAKPENFGKYRPIIENFLSKPADQPITEIGDQ